MTNSPKAGNNLGERGDRHVRLGGLGKSGGAWIVDAPDFEMEAVPVVTDQPLGIARLGIMHDGWPQAGRAREIELVGEERAAGAEQGTVVDRHHLNVIERAGAE